MLENTPNQPSKFRTKKWVEENDESLGTYNVNSQIKFKTSMLRSSLCDYSDAYILVSATIENWNTAIRGANNRKNIIIKNQAAFTNYISELYSTQIDNAKDIDIVMTIYTFIEYSDNYSKRSRILSNDNRNELLLDNSAIIVFSTDNKFKTKIAGGKENN